MAGGRRGRGRTPRPRPSPQPPPTGPVQTVEQFPTPQGPPLINPRAPAPSPDPGSKDAAAVGGSNVGPEQIATPAGAPSPSPLGTPIAGTFSRPGQGKARVLRGARFGGKPFGGKQTLNQVITAGLGSTSPRPLEEESPLRRSLARVFRG